MIRLGISLAGISLLALSKALSAQESKVEVKKIPIPENVYWSKGSVYAVSNDGKRLFGIYFYVNKPNYKLTEWYWTTEKGIYLGRTVQNWQDITLRSEDLKRRDMLAEWNAKYSKEFEFLGKDSRGFPAKPYKHHDPIGGHKTRAIRGFTISANGNVVSGRYSGSYDGIPPRDPRNQDDVIFIWIKGTGFLDLIDYANLDKSFHITKSHLVPALSPDGNTLAVSGTRGFIYVIKLK